MMLTIHKQSIEYTMKETRKEIKYLSLKAINAPYQKDIENAIHEVVDSGWYLQGQKIKTFEKHYADFIGTKHCVSCGNGLDALKLILQGEIVLGRLKLGDEIIVPANTYIATILAITSLGLSPILVEPEIDTLQLDTNLIETHITQRTKAIMTVHLYGKCSITDKMLEICNHHKLLLFEDNAQAHGCLCQLGNNENNKHTFTKRTGSIGNAGAHSFYPGKNLGAMGDAGAVTTNDDELAEVIRALGNYGSAKKYIFDYTGRNSRMDEIQAAVLDVKLAHIDQINQTRISLASLLKSKLSQEIASTCIPSKLFYNLGSYVVHIFPFITPKREKLQQYLKKNGVHTMIHYPIPPHQQKCYTEWNGYSLPITEKIHHEELSLPCNESMAPEDIEYIATLINRFFLEGEKS